MERLDGSPQEIKDRPFLTLIVILLLIWLVAMAFLAAGTVAFQGYIYTEPVRGIVWRAPAAGSAITLFLLLWVIFDYSYPGRYRTLFEFNPREDRKAYPELVVEPRPGERETYKLAKDSRGQPVYRLEGRPDGRLLSGRPLRVIGKEGGQEDVYEPDVEKKKDARGKETWNFKTETGQSLYYREKKTGRVMMEGQLGHASLFRTSNLFANLLLNFLHLGVWFAVLWLLLEFRWGHAFGLAIVFWTVVMLFLLPPVLSKAEEVALQRAAVKTGSG